MTQKNRPIRARKSARLVPLAAAALCVGALIACEDPSTAAQVANLEQAFTVHALTGTPSVFATAFSLSSKTALRVDGSFLFDVAFDIDSLGNIVLLPATVVAQNPNGLRAVGIVTPPTSYDLVTEAPRTGYVVDSVTVVHVGQAAVIQATETTCAGSLSTFMYAKIVVDSINVAGRTLFVRALVDANCGFRSFATGIPGF